MESILQAVGITQEELQERVVARLCEELLSTTVADEDGHGTAVSSRFANKTRTEILERIDAAVKHHLDTHASTQLKTMIANAVLRPTDRWGERKGDPVSLTEYLASRAEAWLIEEVDNSGRDRSDSSFRRDATQKRIQWIAKATLSEEIQKAIQGPLKSAMGILTETLLETVKQNLSAVEKTLAANAPQ